MIQIQIRNITEFRAKVKDIIKQMNKAGINTQLEACNKTANDAKRLAPYGKTDPRFPSYIPGETINGIKVRRIGRGYRVISDVPAKSGGFKQNMWANRTGSSRQPRMRWNKGKPTLYGDGSHNITGTPRFFDRAVQNTQKQYKSIAVRNLKDLLKTGTR